MISVKDFPEDFFWGAATSAYQIEGASMVDGKGLSIWDTFSHQEGKIIQNQNGDKACEHYYRWAEDIKLMQDLGINAYRFSISWPRIFPDHSQRINQKGIDFYDRLIDRLLESGIEPFVTMYHWDLPQYIQDLGGWSSRETSKLFSDYAYALAKHFADRVRYWTTINEPSVATFAGHFWGVHAPGERLPEIALQALHHLLLAHGLAVKAIHDSFDVKVGIALNLSPVFPEDENSPSDVKSAQLYDTYVYRSFLEALFRKKYPAEMGMTDYTVPGDMELIGQPMDYLGINYYTKTRIAFDSKIPLFQGKPVSSNPNFYSDMWEFFPEGLSMVIERIWKDYQTIPIYILENGTSLPDLEIDQGRIEYLKSHLNEIANCLKKGISIKGYFAWSLMDNFEWALGYTKRFGLYSVDFQTLDRTPKASANWFKKLISSN